MNEAGHGRAGGKLILLGEHGVVYGRPALAAGLARGTTVTVRRGAGPVVVSDRAEVAADPRPVRVLVDAAPLFGLAARDLLVEVRSELPPGVGFGSSAAFTVALLRALAALAGRGLSLADELALGRRLEAAFHGTPSGIDPAAAALGSCFAFERGEPPVVRPVRPGAALPLVVAWDGRPRSTGQAVGALRARWEADRARYERLFDAVAIVVGQGTRAVESGDLAALGVAFDANQALLAELGVSSPEVERLVAVARDAGAFGAKLTGGGAGGAVIALVRDAHAVAGALARAGAHTLVATIENQAEAA
ncbi:MAG: mevalonate kinase [Candidatus Binatia bacterium]